MREALGLRTDGTRVTPTPGHRPERLLEHGNGNPRRHRFVQEGEVPVEVMTLRDHGSRASAGGGAAPRHRIDEAALAAERLAREQAERAYADVNERLREVQTKLGHAELARDEALAQAADRQSHIESLRQQLEAVQAELQAQRREIVGPAARKVAAKQAAPKPAPKPRGRQKAPKPVKWWIKSAPAVE